jgi:hypothetical protein
MEEWRQVRDEDNQPRVSERVVSDGSESESDDDERNGVVEEDSGNETNKRGPRTRVRRTRSASA